MSGLGARPSRSSVLLSLTLVWAVIAAWLVYRAHDVDRQERAELASLAHVFAAQAERNLTNAGRILDLIVPRLLDERNDAARRHRLLRLAVNGLPFVFSALHFDDRGVSIGDSGAIDPRPADVSDRAFFKKHQNDPSHDLHIGAPVVSRMTGVWTSTLSRRISGPDGGFAGVLSIGVDPAFFGEAFEAAYEMDVSSITMVDADGRILVRYPKDEAWLGRTPHFTLRDARGSVTITSPIDGVTRRSAYERSTKFGLTVIVGRDDWPIPRVMWVEMTLMAAIGILVSFGFVLGARARRREYAAAEATLNSSERARDAAISEQWRFVSMASHEFRTPLAIIDSAAQRLETFVQDRPDAVRRLARIRSSVVQMVSIIDRTLSSATVIEGKIELHQEPLDLAELLHDCAAKAVQANPEFDIAVDAHRGVAHTHGDRKRLEQVFSNLIANAIKFSGGKRRIELKLDAVDRYWRVSVRDFGIGIQADDIPKLFTRFFRGANAAGISGTGIGLHLVHEFVRMHGGRVYVESQEGDGSTFVVILPRGIRPVIGAEHPRRASA